MGEYRGHTFQHNHKKKILRRTPASMQSSVISLLCRLELTMGTAASELEKLNAIGVGGSQSGGSRVVALNHSRKVGSHYDGQPSQSSNEKS